MKIIDFESLDLIPVKALLSQSDEERLKFFVPAYQRGYRWSGIQVEQLIDDLREFIRGQKNNETAFYCIQPLVVKDCVIDGETYLEVIDGQQRLTTVLILLQAIHQKRYENFIHKKEATTTLIDERFVIKYETRCPSEKWLNEIGGILFDKDAFESFDKKSCDYSHFAEVYRTAYNKLQALNANETEVFYSCLCDRTYFIWYFPQEDDGTNADIFDRLNAGKISLNNAELIKALMLQQSNLQDRQSSALRTIAIEWDNIERRLNDSEFWGFIYSSNHPFAYDTHIEYIFDLFMGKSEANSDERTYTFSKYLESYRTMMQEEGVKDTSRRLKWVDKEWKSVKNIYEALNEWYEDRKLYHRIGFILEYCANYNLLRLFKELSPLNRDERIAKLDEIIKAEVENIRSEKLFYKNKELSEILFLYNILLEDRRYNKTARFSFADYKHVRKESGWDQEHIASQIDYFVKEKDRVMLGKDLIQFISGYDVEESEKQPGSKKIVYSLPKEVDNLSTDERNLCEAWIRVLNNDESCTDGESLSDIYSATLAHYQDTEEPFGTLCYGNGKEKEAKDFIWNIALLNSRTNRSYGNNIYPIKRKRILADEFAVYTPVGTRNVFEKAYSKKITQMTSWSTTDAKAYWDDIKRVVADYVTLKDLI